MRLKHDSLFNFLHKCPGSLHCDLKSHTFSFSQTYLLYISKQFKQYYFRLTRFRPLLRNLYIEVVGFLSHITIKKIINEFETEAINNKLLNLIANIFSGSIHFKKAEALIKLKIVYTERITNAYKSFQKCIATF